MLQKKTASEPGAFAPDIADDLNLKLAAIVGTDKVLTDAAKRTFFSTDISGTGKIAAAVVEVGTVDELARVAALCSNLGVAMVPRGGGFSYTGGYLPTTEASVIIDMRQINQIAEINEEDLYVRVGVGCTWHDLYNTLKARGLRTPYFGPMSGYSATVGGALSQGSFFLGSTEYGTVMESVLSVEVVLANGDVIHTGSDSATGVGPFYRNYGPDLTGLFLADSGALGLKTFATLKLIRFPKHQAYGSFTFAEGPDALAALSEIAREGLAAEAYVWDPYFVKIMSEASAGMRQDLAFLVSVIRNAAGLWDGLTAAARIAMAGKSVFRQGNHMMQVIIDDHSVAGAAERLKMARSIALKHSGREVAPSVPRALRGTPFTDFNTPERRTLQRNLPTNSLYPHSRALPALKAIRQLFADEAEAMKAGGVECGTVFFAVGKNAMCIEPLLYWEDPVHFLHNRVEQSSDLEALAAYDAPLPQTTYVHALRDKLKAVMKANGAVHVQIGKAYDYLPSREPRVAQLVRDLKAAVDPDGLINPGSLGL